MFMGRDGVTLHLKVGPLELLPYVLTGLYQKSALVLQA